MGIYLSKLDAPVREKAYQVRVVTLLFEYSRTFILSITANKQSENSVYVIPIFGWYYYYICIIFTVATVFEIATFPLAIRRRDASHH